MDTKSRDFTDRLESLHTRQDKFYEWAAQLQKEYRQVQQRLAFLESQVKLDMGQKAQEESLLERVNGLKGHNGLKVINELKPAP